ncbi:MAG: citramalate synthase, partial [Pseudooceanicola sp.]|nr:citramalate synthase [Pseudooceanicola sp.]
QAGQSNLRQRLTEAGIEVPKGDRRLGRILERVKEREDEGYAYDSAQASFELLARAELGQLPEFFEVERYRVISERRRNAKGQVVVESEAVVTVQLNDGSKRTGYFKNEHPQDMHDDGPVNALWQALKTDLGPYQDRIADIRLTDFKVRITNGGTEAVTRVIIDFQDDHARRWSTVGVSPNIVDASFEALSDAIRWKLLRDEA